jgi:hypothetical protein
MFALGITASLPAHADEGFNPVDPSDFEVAGVKLGMTIEEARAGFKKYWNASDDQLDMKGKVVLQYNLHRIPNATVAFAIGTKNIVYAIRVDAGHRDVPENELTNIKFLTAKYGKPSFSKPPYFGWCLELAKGKDNACDKEGDMMTLYKPGGWNGGELVLKSKKIHDDGYRSMGINPP